MDGGYRQHLVEHAAALRIDMEITGRKPGTRGFTPIPKRWAVERTYGWLMLHRRLARDYETLPTRSEAVIHIAMTDLMARRLTGENTISWRDPTPQTNHQIRDETTGKTTSQDLLAAIPHLQQVADWCRSGGTICCCAAYCVSASCDPSSVINEYEKLLAGAGRCGLGQPPSHAYGVGARRSRAHTHPVRERRRGAQGSVQQPVLQHFHQGSRYSASPVAVPFLGRIALAAPAAARETRCGCSPAWPWLARRVRRDHRHQRGRMGGGRGGGRPRRPAVVRGAAGRRDGYRPARTTARTNGPGGRRQLTPRWSTSHTSDAVLAELPGLLALSTTMTHDCGPGSPTSGVVSRILHHLPAPSPALACTR